MIFQRLSDFAAGIVIQFLVSKTNQLLVINLVLGNSFISSAKLLKNITSHSDFFVLHGSIHVAEKVFLAFVILEKVFNFI
jgi:hypothetical protein